MSIKYQSINIVVYTVYSRK